MPAQVLSALVEAASAEGAELFPITRPEHRLAAARLSQEAEATEAADRAYRAEIRAWTTTDSRRDDGVLMMTVPHVDAGAGDDVPIRDFDSTGLGWLPVETRSSLNQCLLLLGTLDEGPMAWLRAGEALERVWLESTRQGYVASPLTQLIEVARTNELLRLELQLGMHPHVLLRVGHAANTPPSRRRPLRDLLVESPRSSKPTKDTTPPAFHPRSPQLKNDSSFRAVASAATMRVAGDLVSGRCDERIRSASDHACAGAARGQEAAIELNGLPS